MPLRQPLERHRQLTQHSALLQTQVVAVQAEVRSTIPDAVLGKHAGKEWLQACLHSLCESAHRIAAPPERRAAT